MEEVVSEPGVKAQAILRVSVTGRLRDRTSSLFADAVNPSPDCDRAVMLKARQYRSTIATFERDADEIRRAFKT